MVQKLWCGMCRWRPFWIFLIKNVPNPYPTLIFLVIAHSHTHSKQLKLASYEIFYRLAKIWASFGLLVGRTTETMVDEKYGQ